MGRPAVITRERAAAVALQIIDDEGLDALSLERIAAEMGVRGPSLYHHFADKAEILSEVARLVLGDLDLDQPTQDWQDWLVRVSLTFYRRVLDHPKAAAVLIQFMPDAASVPGFGRAAIMLTEAGVEPSVQLLLMEGSEKIVWGWAIQRATSALQSQRRVTPEHVAHRWPELAAAARDSRWSDEDLLEASLRAFMNGVMEMARP